MSFLDKYIKVGFIDNKKRPVDREILLRQLALASGGHPRSIEYIISSCNYYTGILGIEEILNNAALKFSLKYPQDKNFQQLLNAVLLGETVNGDDLLVGGDPKSESYRSLVKRGVLVDSFDDETGLSFIPTAPELYLYQWALNKQLNAEVRFFLKQILNARYKFTPLKFEKIHSSWEQLMRYVRQGNPKYERIPLNELYHMKLRYGAAPAASCLVDGQSILKDIQYIKDTNITLHPNTIYDPKDINNPGWDRLIVLEIFEVSAEGNTRERYLLPLFIKNKFSREDATTVLSVAEVKSANDICKKFMENRVSFGSGFAPLPTVADNFVLIVVARWNSHGTVFTDSPSNVITCVDEDLERLYGPTLKGLVNSLQPDTSITVGTPRIATSTSKASNLSTQ